MKLLRLVVHVLLKPFHNHHVDISILDQYLFESFEWDMVYKMDEDNYEREFLRLFRRYSYRWYSRMVHHCDRMVRFHDWRVHRERLLRLLVCCSPLLWRWENLPDKCEEFDGKYHVMRHLAKHDRQYFLNGSHQVDQLFVKNYIVFDV